MTGDTLTPLDERFRLVYPTGTVIDAYCGEGATVEEMRATHQWQWSNQSSLYK